MPEIVTRIPAEELAQCNDWTLPDITSKKIIPAVKYQSQRQMDANKQQKDASSKPVKNTVDQPPNTPLKNVTDDEKISSENSDTVESIEEVDIDDVVAEPMTAEMLEKITQDAHKEGFDKGYQEGLEQSKKEGLAQGLKEGEHQIQDKISQLDKVIQSFQNPINDEQEQLQQQMLDIICHLTRSVTERDLHIDSSIIHKVVQQALSLLNPEPKKVTLFLHEKDQATIKELLSEKDLPMEYEIDPQLLPGGCRIDTPHTHIDLSINTRLDEVLDNFLNQRYSQSSQDALHESTEDKIKASVNEGSSPDNFIGSTTEDND